MRISMAFLSLLLVFAAPAAIMAVPSLQLYVSDGAYDFSTETWVTSDNPFTLYVAGAKSPSNITLISDVRLSIAVPTAEYNATGSIAIQGPQESRRTCWQSMKFLAQVDWRPTALQGHRRDYPPTAYTRRSFGPLICPICWLARRGKPS